MKSVLQLSDLAVEREMTSQTPRVEPTKNAFCNCKPAVAAESLLGPSSQCQQPVRCEEKKNVFMFNSQIKYFSYSFSCFNAGLNAILTKLSWLLIMLGKCEQCDSQSGSWKHFLQSNRFAGMQRICLLQLWGLYAICASLSSDYGFAKLTNSC